MNINKYYAHAIRLSNFDVIDFSILEKILKSGYLLSRNRQLEIDASDYWMSYYCSGYNGMDYISLCDLAVERSYYSSFNMYIARGLSMLINRSIPTIKPTLLETSMKNKYSMCELGNRKERYTDLVDEVQVYDNIPLTYLNGLCISLSMFYCYHDNNYLNKYLKLIEYLLERYHYKVNVYNLDNGNVLKKIK